MIKFELQTACEMWAIALHVKISVGKYFLLTNKTGNFVIFPVA